MTHVTCRLTAKNGISSETLRSAIEYGPPLPFLIFKKDVFCNLFNIQKLRASHDNLHLVMLYHLDNVEKIGSTQIGGQLPVSIWQFAELGNVTIRTIVTTESCVPISEDILVNEKGLLYMPLYIRLQYYYARPAEKWSIQNICLEFHKVM